jgi:hypothetical protein
MTFDKEFKAAIGRLPSSEKDKLIWRLLKKDPDLANRLYFELVSCDTREDRRKEAMLKIKRMADMSRESCRYQSPGLLLMDARDTSGIINEHVKVTKDKYGEVCLQIFVLKEFLKIHNAFFKKYPPDSVYTLSIYFVAKTFKIMILLKKMHEDSLIDFADDLAEIADLFADNPFLTEVAMENGLILEWLAKLDIPDNIAAVEKNLRQRGYLR